MIYKEWLDQIQEQKQQAEKKLEKRVGSQKEVEDRLTLLLELEQRIGQHLKDQRKKIDLVCPLIEDPADDGICKHTRRSF